MRLALRKLWQFVRPLLMPVLLIVLAWFTLRGPVTGWLQGEQKYDREAMEEWVREAIVYETLPELAGSYLRLRQRQEQLTEEARTADDARQGRVRDELRALDTKLRNKREEVLVHLKSLGDPSTKIYPKQLVLFPIIYGMTVHFHKRTGLDPVPWDSAKPPLEQFEEWTVPLKTGPNETVEAWVTLRYRLRVYATQQSKERADVNRQSQLLALLLVICVVALFRFYVARRQQRERERQRAEARQQVLEAGQRQQQAERTALELKSQLFANIGIMAGSYAHNIKNLLVRPNDLLGRCLESADLPGEQGQMLHEVRQALGTVTERLQQILQTVRRDPSQSETVRLDLNRLCADLLRDWETLAGDKWKATLRLEAAQEPLWIEGDASHLQQALENLLFNARDATFEMRKYLRDEARGSDAAERKQALIAAAAWRGEIVVRTRHADGWAVLEVTDNGIGMTEEVRQRCTETHFSTKRNNALFEGMTAGMGLGLSFVQVILDHHGAKLEIESQPLRGATFRVRFLLARTGPERGMDR